MKTCQNGSVDLVVGKIRNPAELYSFTEKAVNNTNVEEELH